MKLLMLSKDVGIFYKNSSARERVLEYAKDFEELHVVVLSKSKECFEAETVGNVFIYKHNSRNIISNFLDFFLGSFKSAKKIRGEGSITSQDPFEVGLVAFLLSKIFRLKLEVQIHTDIFSPYFPKVYFLNKLRKAVSILVIKGASKVRVVSERIRESLVKRGVTVPIEVRSVFLDEDKIKKAEVSFDLRKEFPQFKKIILMVGRLEKEKNYSLALEVFKELQENNKEIGLFIIGEGSLRKSLEKKVFEYSLEKNVVFLGKREDVYSCMKTSDVLLHTSFYEGYGLVLKEALLCNLKIVSTNVGIAREVGATIIPFNKEKIFEILINEI